MKRLFSSILFVLLGCLSIHAAAERLPDGLLIVAFDGQDWHPYVVEAGEFQKVKHISNPIDVTWNAKDRVIFYRASDGDIRYESLAAPSSGYNIKQVAATQLRAHPGGLTWVELQNGRSSNTILKSYNSTTDQEVPLFEQASAQFHPLQSGNTLYYSHVSCRQQCRPLIQDIWKYNLVTGTTEQLTMLNSVTYLHSVNSKNTLGYISSNYNGYYNIATLDLKTKAITWITKGAFSDSWPSVDHAGNIFFLRKDKGDVLMTYNKASGRSSTISLPEEIQKIRYVEISK